MLVGKWFWDNGFGMLVGVVWNVGLDGGFAKKLVCRIEILHHIIIMNNNNNNKNVDSIYSIYSIYRL